MFFSKENVVYNEREIFIPPDIVIIPDKIVFKNNSSNRFYIYTKEKLKIKCERIFEINPEKKVVGFTSKNCF